MHLKPDPMGVPRNAFHVFLFLVAFANGIAIAFGQPTSTTLNSQLDQYFLRVYGLLLSVSTLAVLGGMYWPGDIRTGLLWKRTGYVGLTFVTAIFAIALIANSERTTDIILVSSITMGFAGICASWVVKINRRVKMFIPEARHGR